MGWTLETTVKALNTLLSAATYSELQSYEEVLSEEGVSLGNDYVETVDRRKALLSIKEQFVHAQGPSVVLSGWYGSGKTTVMRRIIRDFASGELTYGSLQVDPIEIRLNEHNTMSLFLASLLDSVRALTSEDWLVDTYLKTQALMDLPNLTEQSAQGLIIALQRLPIAQAESVVQFLKELFREYKRYAHGKRVLCLVIDELENIVMAAQQPEAMDHNKLIRLLQIFLDNAAREYIDNEANRRSPYVLVIFSILRLAELEMSKWLRQDTADRCQSIHRDINLTPSTATFLMKSMLRIYLTGILDAACADTADGRLLDWKKQIESASQLDDPLFTYPIMDDVHAFIGQRILFADKRTMVIVRFRAYQKAILTLLESWSGDKPVDMRFVVAQAERLRSALAEYADGVKMKNIIDSTAISNLVSLKFRQLKPGQVSEITRITEAAITRTVAPVVNVSWRDVASLVGEQPTVTEAAFAEILQAISRANVSGWAVSADMLSLEIATIIEQLGTPAKPPSEEDIVAELLKKTSLQRASNTLAHLLCQSIASEATIDPKKSRVDDSGILHVVKRKEPLIEEYLIAFDLEPKLIHELQSESHGLRPGIILTAHSGAEDGELPFSVRVLMPEPLNKHNTRYEESIQKAFTTGATGDVLERVLLPLTSTIMKHEKQGRYQALQEALKVVSLFERLGPSEQQAFKKYRIVRPLLSLFLSPIELSQSDNKEWIRCKLGFRQFHDLDPTRRLIKVLSWTEGKRESLLYETSDEVQSMLRPRVFRQVHLPPKKGWQQELEREWSQEWFLEDLRLKAYGEWPQEVRDRYERVSRELVGKTSRFYEIGRMLFGQSQIDVLPTAVAALHLFLKIGQIDPLGWKLSDDIHETYEPMTVTPTDVLRESDLRRARDQISKLKKQLVICHCIEREGQTRSIEADLEWLLERERELDDQAPLSRIHAIALELSEYQPPSSPPRAKAPDQQVVEKLSQIHPNMGEYCAQLGRLVASDGLFPMFVSNALGSLMNAIKSDTEYEYVCWRLSRLLANWSRQYEDEQPQERMLKVVSDWYTQTLHAQGAWVLDRMREFDRLFATKVDMIRDNRISEDLSGIRGWVKTSVDSVIFPNAAPTFTPADHERVATRLRVEQQSARSEIDESAKALQQGIAQAQQIAADPSVAIYKVEIEQQKNRMSSVLGTVQQASSQLFTSPFGQALKSAAAEIERWATLYAKVQQTKEQRIRGWLSSAGLVAHEEEIIAQFRSVGKSIEFLDEEWLKSGVDILEKLRGGPHELLMIVAASRLLRHLEGGDR